MEKYISKLDSDRFGFKVAKIDDYNEKPEKLLENIQKFGVKLIISKINTKNIDLINYLENNGFCLKDIQLTYQFNLNQINSEIFQTTSNFKIREFLDKDISNMIAIAAESFNDYGHYFADNRLDKKKCLDIYRDWTRRSCLDKNVADKIFVAELNNEVIGFLSFKIYEKKGKKYAAGGLGAVSKKHRNISVFSSIVKKGLVWGSEINLEWEEHNVLSNNYPVNCTFSKIGFKIVNSFVTLHCWPH